MSQSVRVQSYPVTLVSSPIIRLNFLPRGGRANLKTCKEDLIAVLPHDEGTNGADKCLGQIEDDLDQEVECESTGDRLAVADSLISESASYWVVFIEPAGALVSLLLTDEAAVLRVVVCSECHDEHRDDQANHTQDKIEEL